MQLLKRIVAVAALGLAFAGPASAALKVMACEPEWGELVRELGGERVDVVVATGPLQDPHQVQARPSLIARARNADLLACTGAELEIGWLPVLLQQSGNGAIQPGRPGNFEAAAYVTMLEIPTRLDRADGDVHAEGNPHVHTDPRNVARIADALAQRLALLDPAGREVYARRHADFAARWSAAIARWQAKAAPLAGVKVVAQHRSWVYLTAWLGIREMRTLESRPGIEPSVAHLQSVLASLKEQPARMILHAAYQDPRASKWLGTRAGIPVVSLPFTVGGSPAARDLFALFDDTIDRLLQAASQ